jgi:carbon monoxide dehydrogenase subunit G
VELTNEFVVQVGVEEAWKLLTDVELIAPCMPGAQLQEIDGDFYMGVLKVKVGPITAQYKGKATFLEKDDVGHVAVLRAEGRDTRGQGNANATITATLVQEGDGTRVTVLTDLAITGRVAQFGRGVMADVSAKLLRQFVDCLETNILGTGAESAQVGREADGALAGAARGNGSSSAATSTGPRVIESRPAEPVDLLGSAVLAPVVKRLVPALIGALIVFFVGRRLRRWRRG